MYISKKNVNKIQDLLESAIYSVDYYNRSNYDSNIFFRENHEKSNSKLGDCDFWIEYITGKLKALRSLRSGYDKYVKARNLGIDVNIFPYSVEFTSELVQQSEIDNLVDNLALWENRKESLFNKEVA